MAQTQYITVAELAEAFDSRNLATLSRDDNVTGPVDSTSAILVNAIERASADVESHVLRGGRHSIAELEALRDADDWTLKGIVAALAMGHLYRRRGARMSDDTAESVRRADEALKDLGSGKQVFADSGAIAAGKPIVRVVSPSSRASLRMVSDEPYFPARRTTN